MKYYYEVSLLNHEKGNASYVSNQNDYALQPKTHYNPDAKLKDYGPQPFSFDIEAMTLLNDNFRTALWTGQHLQLTLMSLFPGEDIGLENHPNLDQFVRIEQGNGIVKMGNRRDNLDYQAYVSADDAFIIPANSWHNLINTGQTPLKLYSIYAPPQHPFGTVHQTKADAAQAEHHQEY